MPNRSYKSTVVLIAKLKAERKAGKLPPPVSFPDLSVTTSDDRRVAPISNTGIIKFSSLRASSAHHPDAKTFPVGNSHKQGTQLVTPGAIRNGELRYMSGAKPRGD